MVLDLVKVVSGHFILKSGVFLSAMHYSLRLSHQSMNSVYILPVFKPVHALSTILKAIMPAASPMSPLPCMDPGQDWLIQPPNLSVCSKKEQGLPLAEQNRSLHLPLTMCWMQSCIRRPLCQEGSAAKVVTNSTVTSTLLPLQIFSTFLSVFA